MRVIVIGASHAGIDFVDSMRRHGFAGELTMIERLPGHPLERPPLSKTFILASDDEDDRFALRTQGQYVDRRVTLMSGREVVSIDVASRRITLDDGQYVVFDRLVLATGATAREFPTVEARKVAFTLRNPDDARQLRAAAATARSALIIGGGYIGLEIAATLTKAGKKITSIGLRRVALRSPVAVSAFSRRAMVMPASMSSPGNRSRKSKPKWKV